jgi:hypothetical protein
MNISGTPQAKSGYGIGMNAPPILNRNQIDFVDTTRPNIASQVPIDIKFENMNVDSNI